MTSKNLKTVLFGALIAAMILPFSSTNFVEASSLEDKKQKKIDKLEIKLQKIKEQISNIKNKISSLQNKLVKVENNGNDKRVANLQEEILEQENKLVKKETKHNKISEKLDAKKDQINTTKNLITKLEKRITKLNEKIAKNESKGNDSKVEVLTEKLEKSQKRLQKLNDRLERQYAQNDENSVVVAYSIDKINHVLEHAEPHVSINSLSLHLEVNTTGVENDSHMSEKDIEILQEFISINNQMMDVFHSNSKSTESQRDASLESLEAGKFHKLFDPVKNEITNVSYEQGIASFTYLTYADVSSPTKSIFGLDEVEIFDIGRPSPGSSSPVACGGYGMSNPHPDIGVIDTRTGFNSLYEAQSDLLSKSYHQVPGYATFAGESSRPYDYAKAVTSGAPGNCNSGQFRDQAIINTVSYDYKVYGEEPNPEVLSYIWPGLWWPSYVQWWHANF